jgi:hypothetical protein
LRYIECVDDFLSTLSISQELKMTHHSIQSVSAPKQTSADHLLCAQAETISSQQSAKLDANSVGSSSVWQTVGSAEFGDGLIHPVVTRFHAKR